MNLGRHPILPMLSADQWVLLYVRAMLAGVEMAEIENADEYDMTD